MPHPAGTLRLRVWDGAAAHDYYDEDIVLSEPALGQSADASGVEYGSVELELYADLLGASDPLGLPQTDADAPDGIYGWRVAVERATEEAPEGDDPAWAPLLEGVLRLSDVGWDSDDGTHGTWSLRVQEAADEVLFADLDRTNVYAHRVMRAVEALGHGAGYYDVAIGSIFRRDCPDVGAMLRTCVVEAPADGGVIALPGDSAARGHTWAGPDVAFRRRIRTAGAAVAVDERLAMKGPYSTPTEDPGPVNVFVPPWTGSELLAAVSEIRPLQLACSFHAFPAWSVEARAAHFAFDGEPPAGAAPIDLDAPGALGEAGVSIVPEPPEVRDLAVQHAPAVPAPATPPQDWIWRRAVYGAERWALGEEDFGEDPGVAQNGGVLDTKWSPLGSSAGSIQSFAEAPAAGVSEEVYVAEQGDHPQGTDPLEAVYLFEPHALTGGGYGPVIRRIASGVDQASAHWAEAAFERRAALAATTRVVQLSADLAAFVPPGGGLPAVRALASYATYRGLAWQVVDVQIELDTPLARLALARPAYLPVPAADPTP